MTKNKIGFFFIFIFLLFLPSCLGKETDHLFPTLIHQTPLSATPFPNLATETPSLLVKPTSEKSITPTHALTTIPTCSPSTTLGNYTLEGELGPMAVRNGVGYIAVGSRILTFDPYCAHITGVAVSNDKSLVGPVVFDNKNLYVGSGSFLEIFDLSAPYSLSKVTSLVLDSEVTTMTLEETQNHLFVGLRNGKIGIIDTNTWKISYWQGDIAGYIAEIESYKNILFLAISDPINYQSGELRLFNILGNGQLSLISSLNLGDVTDIEVSDDRIYSIAYDQKLFGYGLFIFELSQSSDINLLGQYTPPSDVPFNDLVVTERFAYLRGAHCEIESCHTSIEVLDINEPSDPKPAQDWTSAEDQNSHNTTGWVIILNGNLYVVTDTKIEIWNILRYGEWKIKSVILFRE